MNVLIACGGRDFSEHFEEHKEIEAVIQQFKLQKNNTVIMSGGARGADTIALEWAHDNEWNAMRVPAKWNDLGKSAGMCRNLEMLELAVRMYANGDQVIVLAMPGGIGTSGMVSYAKKHAHHYRFISVVDRR